ncbi:MAG: serine/threonine-protein kinase, partial [Planctomycetota bacterium]
MCAEARKEEELFLRVALTKNFITREQAQTALQRQKALNAQGLGKEIGAVLQKLGALKPDKVDLIRALQNKVFMTCPGCDAFFNIEGQNPGQRFICKRCKTVLSVPSSDPTIHVDLALPARESVPEPDGRPSKMVGERLGGCEILELIGRGGMGAVFKATQLSLKRTVAVKLLPETFLHDKNYISRFEREARIVAQLTHPNIVQVYDMGRGPKGLYYIVMEYMAGGAVGEKLDDPLPEGQALRYIVDAAQGLAVAHAEKILHRDIKPDNLLIDKFGRVKVADFGLARGVEATVKLTGSGAALGTPAFMSPEQGMGYKVDHRGDIYSLGATLFTLLTGEYPYEATSPVSMVI